jgi:hypothetical protein
VHEGLRHGQQFGEGAVPMHAEHLDVHAAVGLADAAGDAAPAGQVGHHEHRFAGAQRAARWRFGHHARQFVAHHARVLEVRLVAREDVQVRAAHADAPDAHQHIGFAAHRFGTVLGLQHARRAADHGQHVIPCRWRGGWSR